MVSGSVVCGFVVVETVGYRVVEYEEESLPMLLDK
jgi:hypothetical protein